MLINEGDWLLNFILNLQGITVLAILLEEIQFQLVAKSNLKKEIKYTEVK